MQNGVLKSHDEKIQKFANCKWQPVTVLEIIFDYILSSCAINVKIECISRIARIWVTKIANFKNSRWPMAAIFENRFVLTPQPRIIYK